VLFRSVLSVYTKNQNATENNNHSNALKNIVRHLVWIPGSARPNALQGMWRYSYLHPCSCVTNFFYREANSIFGKIGRIASEEVILQLIKSKHISVLPYGLEACHLAKAQLHSLDFVVNHFV